MKIFGLDLRRLIRPGPVRGSGVAMPLRTLSGPVVTPETAMRLSAVYACVQVIAQAIASLPLVLYRRTTDDSRQRATDHALYTLLHDQPNPHMTAYQFKLVLAMQQALQGNAYAEIQRDERGRVVALWPLPAETYNVRIEITDDGQLVYHVRVPGSGEDVLLMQEQVLHVMGITTNGYVGLSPIAACRQSIGLGLAAEEYGARFFGQGAALQGIIYHPGRLSAESVQRLRDEWASRYEGAANAWRTPVLEEGMTYQPIGLSPRDAAFIETRQYQVLDICRIFRVPPHMVAELGRATWSNVEQLGQEFITYTLRPWLTSWEQAISQRVLSVTERKTLFAEFLTHDLLRGDTMSRYQAYAVGRQYGWLSANDIRRAENMSTIDGGDVVVMPLNLSPFGSVEESRGLEQRASRRSSVDARRTVRDKCIPLIADMLVRTIRRDRSDILRAARKQSMTDDMLRQYIYDYYSDERVEQIRKQALVVYHTYAELLQAEIDQELGRRDVADYLDEVVHKHVGIMAKRQAVSRSQRLRGVLRAEVEDRVAALETEFDEMEEKTAPADARYEATKFGSKLYLAACAAAGYAVIRWIASADACPLCQEMSDKTVAINQAFVAAGTTLTAAGVAPLVIGASAITEPPLHDGCQCMLSI